MAAIRSTTTILGNHSVVQTVALLRRDDNDEYMARIATALILLGHGYTDEAHNLVSSLSWPKELPFSYGPPIATEPEILALSSYSHCLVHRREGPNDSEFGMKGFANADYWAGAALRSGGEETLPLEEIRNSIGNLAQESNLAHEWIMEDDKNVGEWDPRPLTHLCAQVLAGENTVLREFAQQAARVELQVLLKHTLSRLGYDTSLLDEFS